MPCIAPDNDAPEYEPEGMGEALAECAKGVCGGGAGGTKEPAYEDEDDGKLCFSAL